jgi:hypothetical protein
MEESQYKNIFSCLEVCYILGVDFNADLVSVERGVVIGRFAGIGVVRSMAHSPALTRHLLN